MKSEKKRGEQNKNRSYTFGNVFRLTKKLFLSKIMVRDYVTHYLNMVQIWKQ